MHGRIDAIENVEVSVKRPVILSRHHRKVEVPPSACRNSCQRNTTKVLNTGPASPCKGNHQ